MIEQNKNQELRKNLQSAGHIRKDRGKAKVLLFLRLGSKITNSERSKIKYKENEEGKILTGAIGV